MVYLIRSALCYSKDVVTYIFLGISVLKILGTTCDNASANDAMLDELELTLAHFEGKGTRARCILHIGNLVAKTLIKQFDIPQHKERENVAAEVDEGREVDENEVMDVIGNDLEKDNDVDGWIDEAALMSTQEKASLEQNIRPVRSALAKVTND